jgi:hypothetical protein
LNYLICVSSLAIYEGVLLASMNCVQFTRGQGKEMKGDAANLDQDLW